MSDYSFREAAELAGVAYNTFKQHVARHKIEVIRSGSEPRIDDDALHAYMVAEGLMDVAEHAKAKSVEEIAEAIQVPMGVLFSRLPSAGQEALLEGIRTQDTEPFRKWKMRHEREMRDRATEPIDIRPMTARERHPVPKTGKRE